MCVVNSLHAKGYLTAPPLSEDTLIMIMTGWDWPTYCATPERVIEEMLIYLNTKNEYERQALENG